MKRRNLLILIVAVALMVSLSSAATALGNREFPDPPKVSGNGLSGTDGLSDSESSTQTAVLAGGCFWGMEGVFEMLVGVSEVRSGYAGGDESTARYYTVASGQTDHAEAIEIVYDPSVITYGTLLEIFFAVAHDPTQLNYQGPDHGTQYRSAIFYANEAEKTLAEAYIERLEQLKVYDQPVVTGLEPLTEFYPAEDYHQDFILKNPTYPYVVYWDIPKMKHLQEAFPELVAERETGYEF